MVMAPRHPHHPRHPLNTDPATGDRKLNTVLDNPGKHLNVTLVIAAKVGHKLAAMVKKDPKRVAYMMARMIQLEASGSLKMPKGHATLAHSTMFNAALKVLLTKHPLIAQGFALPTELYPVHRREG